MSICPASTGTKPPAASAWRGRKLLELSGELAAANRRLETPSHQDGLTGIANRGAFDFLLGRQFAHAARHREPLSMVLCDVDHFKAGACKRETDLAARYGGEEFALALPDTPAEAALHVVEAAQRNVAALAIAIHRR